MKKILVIIFALLSTLLVSAQKRNINSARRLACEHILQSKRMGLFKQSQSRLVDMTRIVLNRIGQHQEEHIPYFVLADSLNPSSYVIVSGDERMRTVLAFGENGNWNEENIPDGLLYLLEHYKNQYELLQIGGIEKRSTPQNIAIPNVTPLLKTVWRQDTPFNLHCPEGCPSGCVATAMSQVMKYHGFPTSGNDSFSYTSKTKKYRCSYDFSTASFDWNLMKNSYGTSSIKNESTEMLSQVTYACGVSVGMDYDKTGSGAYMSDVPYALIHFFGYNKNASYRYRTYYDASEWYQMLCEELSCGRPVIYGGVDSKNGGHAFVIDGCDSASKKFHVNWGWGGNFDDYYELDALDPEHFKFSSYQDMIVYVSPDPVGIAEDVFYAEKFSVSPKIELGGNVVFSLIDVACFASKSSYVVSKAKFFGRIGVGIFDKDFNYLSSLDSDSIDGINNFHGFSKVTYNVKINRSLFSDNGTYYIAPYVQEKNSPKPTRIRTYGGKTDYITITIDGDDVNSDSEDENPAEVVSEWSEDFEYRSLPSYWKQEIEMGKSKWDLRYVLIPSNDVPAAAHGKGYAYINYSTGFNINNFRTVTRLISPAISLDTANKYKLTFQCRKMSSQPESSDILTVYYKDGNNWSVLSEIAVTSQGDWHESIVEIPYIDHLQLAFEGSPAQGSVIMLDDIRIFKSDEEPLMIESVNLNCDEEYEVFTLSGIMIGRVSRFDGIRQKLPKGTYILRVNNKISKVFIN